MAGEADDARRQGIDALLAETGLTAADLVGLTWGAFVVSLVPVTLGNIIGGGVLVGGVYWFVYLIPPSGSRDLFLCSLGEAATAARRKRRRESEDPCSGSKISLEVIRRR